MTGPWSCGPVHHIRLFVEHLVEGEEEGLDHDGVEDGGAEHDGHLGERRGQRGTHDDGAQDGEEGTRDQGGEQTGDEGIDLAAADV